MRGIIYWNPVLYNLAMKIIYGRDFRRRYKLVAKNIERGWGVLDLCCGNCYFKKFLDKSIKYEGRDFNKAFIKYAGHRGINASFCDLNKDFKEEKKFECVIMIDSLYHFIPNGGRIIDKMKHIATKRVIISEPARNITSSKNRFISFLAKLISSTGHEEISDIKRYSHNDIALLFKRHNVSRIIDAGKDIIGVFDL